MSNFYLGHTRTKKLYKLYLLSKEIIKTYGFNYFLKVSFSELSRQKLKLFSPDTSEFKPDNTLFNFERKISYYDIFENKLVTTQKISIVIILDGNTSQNDLDFLISNILNQTYQNFEVIIINTTEKKFQIKELAKNSKIKIDYIQTKQDFSLSEIFNKINSEFTLFLNSNVIIDNEDAILFFITFAIKNPDMDLFYSDSLEIDSSKNEKKYFLKPDWSPNLFLHYDYFSNCFMLKHDILLQVNSNHLSTRSLLFDLLLNLTSYTKKICHIPLPLYALSKTISSYPEIISNHIKRNNIDGKIVKGIRSNTFKIDFKLNDFPKVSIIIPTKNNFKILKRCISSIEKYSDYKNWEVIIVDNHSTNKETLSYYDSISYTVLDYDHPFNFSKMNNYAVTFAKGDFLLFLNDDTAALHSSWLLEMMKLCTQKNIGAVGSMLVHSDNTIQHCGVSFLRTGSGFHPFQRVPINQDVYHNIPFIVRDVSAVTGACLLTKKEIFEEINGFDDDFDLYYGDSDLCLKIRNHGYDVVYTPFAKLLHEGSLSIKKYTNTFFAIENHQQFIKKWPQMLNYDPFYHPLLDWNYNLANEDEQIKILKKILNHL